MNLSLYIAYKNLVNHKKLFLLLIGILIFSFINLTFFSALTNGVRDVTNSKLRNYAFSDLRILPGEENLLIDNTQSVLKKVRAIPGVQSVTERLVTQETLFDGEKRYSITLVGINVLSELYVSEYDKAVKKGEFLSSGASSNVVLGDEIVGNLDGSQSNIDFEPLDLEVGDSFRMLYSNKIEKDYKVNGIFDTVFWVTDFNTLISIEELRNIYNYDNQISSEILIKLEDGVDKNKVKEEIINNGIKYRVEDSIEEKGIAENILSSQKITTTLANIIGIFSTFITTFIIIYINVSNNRKQLIILKAIGINENKIIKSYLIQSLFYAIFGVIFGIIGLYIIIFYIKLNPIKLPMGYFYPIATLGEILIASCILIASAVLAGYFASSRIIKSDIIKVLRGE